MGKTGRRLGIVRITYESLAELLGLPKGTSILTCRTWEQSSAYPWNDGPRLGHLEIVCEHPELYEVREGEVIPRIDPTYERIEINVFRDWGK